MKLIVRLFTVLIMFSFFFSCDNNDDSQATTTNLIYSATLNGANEVPANNSTATGTATLTFNTVTKAFTISVIYNGVTASAGHIHKAASGQSGPPVFPFSSLSSPINFTSDPLDASMEGDLNANLYYVNIHSSTFPGGEIRGQLIKNSSQGGSTTY